MVSSALSDFFSGKNHWLKGFALSLLERFRLGKMFYELRGSPFGFFGTIRFFPGRINFDKSVHKLSLFKTHFAF